ncbi:MAG TPA: acyltransferase, partial [Verrucomicrobia bacterium]|nr:acyltransferase [Verrucomicrobiota bacterium]
LRGFAAVAVMVAHYLGFFGPGRDLIAAMICVPALPAEAHPVEFYSLWLDASPFFNLAPFGVALFFIISGFVIPFSLQKMSWLGFSVNRLFRIVPTYLAGFSLTLFALLLGTRYFDVAWPYRLPEVLIHYVPGIRDILWSRHIDFIVWTLEIELKFYFLCAVLIVWLRRYSLKAFGAPVILFLLALLLDRMLPGWEKNHASFYRLGMVLLTASRYIIFMFIGVMFHFLHRGKVNRNTACLGIFSLYALFCLHGLAGPYPWSPVLAGSYGIALLTFAFAYVFPGPFRGNRVFNFLADISYPLYVIHAIAGFTALRILSEKGFPHGLSLILVMAGCMFFAWLLHVLVEDPSQILGKKLCLQLTGNSLSPAKPPPSA